VKTKGNANRVIAIIVPGRTTYGQFWTPGVAAEEPVVEIVSVAVIVVVFEFRLMLVGDTLQVVFAGRPAHCGIKLKVPLNPFIAAKVNVVLPEAPGLETVTVFGFAEIENVGPSTVRVACPEVVGQ
jgi:hypothetical protein